MFLVPSPCLGHSSTLPPPPSLLPILVGSNNRSTAIVPDEVLSVNIIAESRIIMITIEPDVLVNNSFMVCHLVLQLKAALIVWCLPLSVPRMFVLLTWRPWSLLLILSLQLLSRLMAPSKLSFLLLKRAVSWKCIILLCSTSVVFSFSSECIVCPV